MFFKFLNRWWTRIFGPSESSQHEPVNDIRIEVLKNGERACVIGTRDGSGLSVTVNYVDTEFVENRLEMSLGGFGWNLPQQTDEGLVAWIPPSIEVGDQITFRILPPGEFDTPMDLHGEAIDR